MSIKILTKLILKFSLFVFIILPFTQSGSVFAFTNSWSEEPLWLNQEFVVLDILGLSEGERTNYLSRRPDSDSDINLIEVRTGRHGVDGYFKLLAIKIVEEKHQSIIFKESDLAVGLSKKRVTLANDP